MSGGGLVCDIDIGLVLCNCTHLCCLRCAGNLALHCGEVSRKILASLKILQKVEAVFLIVSI